jgi:DNA-binding response OmpR family regulator
MAASKIASSTDVCTVLVISPDGQLAGALEGLFRQKKYFVINEITAGHALQTANLLKPALILFNVEPHSSEHLTLCRDLRGTTSGAILLLAPPQENAQAFEYYQAGIVDEHIPTPVNPLVIWLRSMVWLAKYEYASRRMGSTLMYA